jgi:hypothetical protein
MDPCEACFEVSRGIPSLPRAAAPLSMSRLTLAKILFKIISFDCSVQPRPLVPQPRDPRSLNLRPNRFPKISDLKRSGNSLCIPLESFIDSESSGVSERRLAVILGV